MPTTNTNEEDGPLYVQVPPSSVSSRPSSDRLTTTVASRLRERVEQVQREEEMLENIRGQWVQAQEQLMQQERIYGQVRRGLLQTLQRLYYVEQEFMDLRERTVQCQESTTRINAERQLIEMELLQDHETWQGTVLQGILVPHITQRELYLQKLQTDIHGREMIKLRREQYREYLQAQIGSIQADCDWALQQQEQVKSDVERLRNLQDEENKKADGLAEQIREALQRVRVVNGHLPFVV